jgi:hypothetical protein
MPRRGFESKTGTIKAVHSRSNPMRLVLESEMNWESGRHAFAGVFVVDEHRALGFVGFVH